MNPYSSFPETAPETGPQTPPALPKQSSMALVRAMFGPLMLLVTGILFAIDYAGGPGVVRTWPVLIIAAGLLKLGEFAGARNT
jgi:hypothetical protein